MALSDSVVNQFAKMVNNDKKQDNGVTVKGTFQNIGGVDYVRIDGSDILTPVNSLVEAETGERVTVEIKDHEATVTGNISSPMARSKSVTDLKDEVDEFGNTIQQMDNTIIQQNNSIIQMENAINQQNNVINQHDNKINQFGDTINSFNNKITQMGNDITEIDNKIVSQGNLIDSMNNTITEFGDNITSMNNIVNSFDNRITQNSNTIEQYGNIINQQNDKITSIDNSITQINNTVIQQNNTINELGNRVTNINNTVTQINNDITVLDSNIRIINSGLVIENGVLTGLSDIIVDNLRSNVLDVEFAKIDFANINVAAVEKLFTESGIIKDLVVKEGHITGELVGVVIKGDLIEAGTLVADKLVVLGEDGLYYKLNATGETVTSQQTAYNSLNGSVITAKSVTADKVSVTDLVAFGATIGGFEIGENSIHSVTKGSINSDDDGLYMDKIGQLYFGNANKHLKYYYDAAEDKWKLSIRTDELYLGSSNKTVTQVLETRIGTSGNPIIVHDAGAYKLYKECIDGKTEQKETNKGNLLYTPYTKFNKLTITSTKDDNWVCTDYYAELEAGKEYTFSGESDGTYSTVNGTETVEFFLLKDKSTNAYISIGDKNYRTFIPSSSGKYYVRCDVNKAGVTHSFWNFMIKEGSSLDEWEQSCISPTPDFESEIKNVSGEANLFSLQNYFEHCGPGHNCQKELTSNGVKITFTQGIDAWIGDVSSSGAQLASDRRKGCIKVKPNTEYLIICGKNFMKSFISFYDKSYMQSRSYIQLKDTSRIASFITNDKTEYIYLRLGVQHNSYNEYEFNDIVIKEKPSKVLDYIPEGHWIRQVSSTKNMLNVYSQDEINVSGIDTFEILEDDWIHYVNNSGGSRIKRFGLFAVDYDSTYYLNVERKDTTGSPYNVMLQYDDDFKILSTTYPNNSTSIKITNKKTKYIGLGITSNNMTSTCDYKVRLMFVKSDIPDNEYVSFKRNVAFIDMNKPNKFLKNFEQGTGQDPNTRNRIFNNSVFKVEKNHNYTFATDLNFDIFRYAIQLYQSESFEKTDDIYYNSGWITAKEFTFATHIDGYLKVMISRHDEKDIFPSDILEYDFMLYDGAKPYYEISHIDDVQDTFDNGELIKKTRSLIIRGDSNVSIGKITNNSNDNFVQFNLSLSGMVKDIDVSKTGSRFKSNYFKYYSEATAGGKTKPGARLYQGNVFVISFPTTLGTTEAEFKKWLNDHPIEFEYVSTSEPEIYRLNYEKLLLHKGHNIITIDDNLSPNLRIEYLTDSELNDYYASRKQVEEIDDDLEGVHGTLSEQQQTNSRLITQIEETNSYIEKKSDEINNYVESVQTTLSQDITGVSNDLAKATNDLVLAIQSNTTLIQQLATSVTTTIKTTGGSNLLKNSVGFSGTDFWAPSGNITTNQDDDMSLSGSEFILTGAATLSQPFNTQPGFKYSLSCKIKHKAVGTANTVTIKITGQGADIVLINNATVYNEWTMLHLEDGFIAEITSPTLVISCTGDDILEVTDLIIANGDNEVWSGYIDEVYGKEHKLDGTGLRLSNLQTDNLSKLTSTSLQMLDGSNVSAELSKNKAKSDTAEITNAIYLRKLDMVALDDNNIIEYVHGGA